MFQLLSYVTLVAISFVIIRTIISSFNNHPKLPPGPIALPVIGHLHLLGPFLHQTLHNLSSLYGPLMFLRVGSVGCVVASNPDMAKELLKTHELAFAARMHTAAITHITYDSSFAFAPYGPYWKFVKKFSTNQLLGNKTLSHFLPIRTKEMHCFLKFILEKSKAGETVNVTEELLKLTNNTISLMMLSMKCSGTGEYGDEIRALVREVTKIFGEFNISDCIWFLKYWDVQGIRKRFQDIHTRFDALLEKIIKEREQVRKNKQKISGVERENEVNDFLDMMLDVMERDVSEIRLTKNHVKALLLDFFTAGTDTTSIVLEWALAEMINNPTVLKKAQQEIDQVVGKTNLVQDSDVPRLNYIQAIIKETFRLHPPIPMINRKSIKPCKVSGYDIPANCMVFVNIWGMARDPRVWPDPHRFWPDRFLKSAADDDGKDVIDVRGLHFELLPFGTGRRGCPGASLALQEIYLTLAAMVQCFEWKVVGGGDGTVDMAERAGLTAPRARDLVCLPITRFTPTLTLD